MSDAGQKQYYDAIIVVPLEEEFTVILDQFRCDVDVSDDAHVRFAVSLPDVPARFLLVRQSGMGRSATQEALSACLAEFDAGLAICAGIAGGLSGDVAIGDVCYTGRVIDVLDNVKVRDGHSGGENLALSPTFYETPREVSVPIARERISPATRASHEAWSAAQGASGRALVPGEFTGRDGRKETITDPQVHEGAIACGLVSGSPSYNEKLRAIDRKVLALETESGALFAVAKQRGMPALTIRGVSDYAGRDKNQFEHETGNKARQVAVANAATFLARQLGSPLLLSYFQKARARRSGSGPELPLLPANPADTVCDLLLRQGEEFDTKLRDLNPAFALRSKGYRLPIPRVRMIGRTGLAGSSRGEPVDLRDALKATRVLTLHVPREYPDLSLSWAIASDLLSAQVGNRQLVPAVIEAKNLQRPRFGIAELADPSVRALRDDQQVRLVFLIDDFGFDSKTRAEFLRAQVEQWADAQFIVVTRSPGSAPFVADFNAGASAVSAQVCDVPFQEISHFLQKNFEMPAPASQVVALELRDTFRKYSLPTHPSYFAGIPGTTLQALLRANRRAELIELAVAGYLSFVVAQDKEPVALSRTTREQFLSELVHAVRVEGKSYTEAGLADYAAGFAARYDYPISPARFVASFFERSILHAEDGVVRFTLPFIEAFLLAKRLADDPAAAGRYFASDPDAFDHETFTLYAEMGASADLVARMLGDLQSSIDELAAARSGQSILLENKVFPALLEKTDRLQRVQKSIEKAEEDVRTGRDQSHEKQRLLDASDRVRETTASRRSARHQDPPQQERPDHGSMEARAWAIWSQSVVLLGAGAERLEAGTKRELIGRIARISELIIDGWTRDALKIDFRAVKDELLADQGLLRGMARSETEQDLDEAKRVVGGLVDFFEFVVLTTPLGSVVAYLCDEARDGVLAESMLKAGAGGPAEMLVRNLWLSNVSVQKGKKDLLKSIKGLPASRFVRTALAGHLISRAYWRQWDKQDRLDLLHIAGEALRGTGMQWDVSKLERTLEKLDGKEAAD